MRKKALQYWAQKIMTALSCALCRFQKNKFTSAARNIVAAILQLHYGTKYIPKHVCPMKPLQLRRERCLRQYMPILRMRIRTGKTRRQNVFSPMRILFRISADYAPLWNTGAAALCRIKIFRNKSVRKKHLILTFNHFDLSIEPASGRQQEDGDGFLFPNPRDGKYRKHLITHFFNKKTSGIQEIDSLIWGGQCRLSLCRSLLSNGQPMRQL